MLLAQKNFWASVPKSDDLMSVSFNWEAKCSGQTEISKLTNGSIITDEQVLWLQVSVENPILM
jgi:hypothetical protein